MSKNLNSEIYTILEITNMTYSPSSEAIILSHVAM